jgi:aspartate/methionine/tyrosine aminotransferase
MILSSRINKVEASGIRKVFDMAMALGPKATNLSIGQPHFRVPMLLKKEAKKAISKNFNSYLPTQGYEPLREKIATKLKTKNNITASKEDIIISSGVSGALYLLFASTLNPEDEVILPDPYFVLYKELLAYFGIKIVTHDTYPDFHLKPKEIEKLITPKTKMIIVNSPNNPTGMVYSQSELTELSQIADKHNLLVLSDEIYEDFDYEKKFFSIGSIYTKTITLSGFSKNLAITGWRLGYAHGPSEIIKAMSKLQMYTFVCAPSFAQVAVSEIMDKAIDIYDYTENRNYLYKNLKNHYEIRMPEGAFYAYLKIPDSIPDFLNKIFEQGLLVVPGEVFSSFKNYFRLSFAVKPSVLKNGVAILKKIKLDK